MGVMGFERLLRWLTQRREDAKFFKVGFCVGWWRLRLVGLMGFGRLFLNHITNEVQERRRQRHRDTERFF